MNSNLTSEWLEALFRKSLCDLSFMPFKRICLWLVAGEELASMRERIAQLRDRITTQDVSKLKSWIDQMDERYGMPSGFVVPGASLDSAALHLARSVCRRVERLIVSLNHITRTYEVVIVYFNRLSDLLFVLSWATAVIAAIEEVLTGLIAVSRSPAKGRH